MKLSDSEMEMLEMYVDGELPLEQRQAITQRLREDSAMVRVLESIKQERASREAWLASLEPDEPAVEATVRRIEGGVHRRRAWVGRLRILRLATAAAACLAIGLAMGYLSRGIPGPAGGISGVSPVAQPVTGGYQVAVTDETGKVVAVQRFQTLDEAKAFSDDLQRWQERQDQLRSGRVTVRSASF